MAWLVYIKYQTLDIACTGITNIVDSQSQALLGTQQNILSRNTFLSRNTGRQRTGIFGSTQDGSSVPTPNFISKKPNLIGEIDQAVRR